jgi:hypothetical protein
MRLPRGTYPELTFDHSTSGDAAGETPRQPQRRIAVLPCSATWGGGMAREICNPGSDAEVVIDTAGHIRLVRAALSVTTAHGDNHPRFQSRAVGLPRDPHAGTLDKSWASGRLLSGLADGTGSSADDDGQLCKRGYTGRQCGACASGFFSTRSQCVPCADHVSLDFSGPHGADKLAGAVAVSIISVSAIAALVILVARGHADRRGAAADTAFMRGAGGSNVAPCGGRSLTGRVLVYAVMICAAMTTAIVGALMKVGILAVAASSAVIIAGKYLIDAASGGLISTAVPCRSFPTTDTGPAARKRAFDGDNSTPLPVIETAIQPLLRTPAGFDAEAAGEMHLDGVPVAREITPKFQGLASEVLLFSQSVYLISSPVLNLNSLSIVQRGMSLFPSPGPWLSCGSSALMSSQGDSGAQDLLWTAPLIAVALIPVAAICLTALGAAAHATRHGWRRMQHPPVAQLALHAAAFAAYFFALPVFSACARGLVLTESNGSLFWAANVTVPAQSAAFEQSAVASALSLVVSFAAAQMAVFVARRSLSDSPVGRALHLSILRRYEGAGFKTHSRLEHVMMIKRLALAVAVRWTGPVVRNTLLAAVLATAPALMAVRAPQLAARRFAVAEAVTSVVLMSVALVSASAISNIISWTGTMVCFVAGVVLLAWRSPAMVTAENPAGTAASD